MNEKWNETSIHIPCSNLPNTPLDSWGCFHFFYMLWVSWPYASYVIYIHIFVQVVYKILSTFLADPRQPWFENGGWSPCGLKLIVIVAEAIVSHQVWEKLGGLLKLAMALQCSAVNANQGFSSDFLSNWLTFKIIIDRFEKVKY